MTIGEAAARLGIETHVLRHWDAVGALHPSARTSACHRRCTAADIDRARVVLRCQRAGLSLADISGLGASRGTRRSIVSSNLEQLHAQRDSRGEPTYIPLIAVIEYRDGAIRGIREY